MKQAAFIYISTPTFNWIAPHVPDNTLSNVYIECALNVTNIQNVYLKCCRRCRHHHCHWLLLLLLLPNAIRTVKCYRKLYFVWCRSQVCRDGWHFQIWNVQMNRQTFDIFHKFIFGRFYSVPSLLYEQSHEKERTNRCGRVVQLPALVYHTTD